MNQVVIIQLMTLDEARECIRTIKQHMNDARRAAQELYEREGWKALGYESFRACAEAEFGQSWQHLYRLRDAAEIEGDLRNSPMGETLPPTPIPERHTRALKALPTAEQRVDAYIHAQDAAKAEGAELVQQRHIEVGVEVVKAKQSASKYAVIGHMVATGDITPFEGKAIVEHLDRMKPKVRGDVCQLVTKYGLTCPDLVPEIGQMFDRKPGQESKVLQVTLQTGCLGGVPLKKATLSDLRRARQEASYEHAAEELEKRRQAGQAVVEPIVINVYKGDPTRTLRALKKALPAADLIRLQQLITDNL